MILLYLLNILVYILMAVIIKLILKYKKNKFDVNDKSKTNKVFKIFINFKEKYEWDGF